jgi:dual-specificity kinase
LDDREGHIKITPGQTITPRYTVREVLGEGTFGKVLDCWDRKLEKNVALKVVRAVDKYKDAAMIEIDILEKLQKYGCEGKDMCISLLDWFEYRNHIVMSFDRFGLSLYDFIKQNHYQGFSIEIVEEMGYQLLKAIAFMHDLTLIHTDLKPENILLVNSQSEEVPISPDEALRRSRSRSRSSSRSRSPGATERIKRVPINSAIKVIDFGSATFDSHHHTRVISTRHYRAPEVILGGPSLPFLPSLLFPFTRHGAPPDVLN